MKKTIMVLGIIYLGAKIDNSPNTALFFGVLMGVTLMISALGKSRK